MTQRRSAFTAVLAAAIALTGFATTSASAATAGFVGVILPDAASSTRWESADLPILNAAFKAAGVTVDIQNANGDVAAFQTIADQMLSRGAKVLILVNLDSSSAKEVQDRAKAQDVATIDYDRLTLDGSASYYVSFDNVAIGKLLGRGIISCLIGMHKKSARIVYLNGSPNDNNATLFKHGYESVLRPYIKSKRYTLVDDTSVPGGDSVKGGTIFEQQLAKAGGNLDAVVAANEGLGLAAVAILKKDKLIGKVCVSAPIATFQGLRAILMGELSNGVYNAINAEANAVVSVAVALLQGKPATAAKAKVNNGTINVPSVLLLPIGITRANVKSVIADGFLKRADVCKGIEKLCKRYKV
jgi:D-xylose transport system substrate-binding protein